MRPLNMNGYSFVLKYNTKLSKNDSKLLVWNKELYKKKFSCLYKTLFRLVSHAIILSTVYVTKLTTSSFSIETFASRHKLSLAPTFRAKIWHAISPQWQTIPILFMFLFGKEAAPLKLHLPQTVTLWNRLLRGFFLEDYKLQVHYLFYIFS